MTESLFHVVVGYHASQGALLRTTIILFLGNIVIIIIIIVVVVLFGLSCPLIPEPNRCMLVTYVVCCVSLGRGDCLVCLPGII